MASLSAGKPRKADYVTLSTIASKLEKSGILARLTSPDEATNWMYLSVLTYSYLSSAPQDLVSQGVKDALADI